MKVLLPPTTIADAPEKNEHGPAPARLTRNRFLYYSVGTLTLLAVCLSLRYAKDLFVPVILAIFIGYTLDPLVTWFVRRMHIPRYLASAMVLLAALGGSLGTAYAFRGQVFTLLDN